MSRLTRVDAAFLAVTGGVWVGLAVGPDAPWIDRFFGAVMFTCLLVLLRLGVLAWLGARVARHRAVEAGRVLPDEVARRAVEEERARLATDIARALRGNLAAVLAEAHSLPGSADPVPGLQRVQAQTRRATSDLRRQLGLLRTPLEEAPAPPQHPAARGGDGPSRRDALVAVVMALLAAVEVTVYVRMEGFGSGASPDASLPVSVALSVLAAGSIVLRRADPVAGALWCAAAFGLGTLLGSPVGGGFWAVATVGALVWGLTTAVPVNWGVAAGWCALSGTIVHSRLADDRDNALIFAVLVAVVTVAGLVVHVGRRQAGRAVARTRAHEEAVASVTRDAVRRERQEYAREIHDVVSHAVGLIAMQAAAAEVSWPHDPAAVERALAVIAGTAGSTLAELDRLLPGAESSEAPSLHDLVERIRAAGVEVHLDQQGGPDDVVAPLVHRVVQEGLTNALRHAPGSTVSVRVTSQGGECEVVVVDDGPGTNDRHQPGYGLIGLDERVTQAGGTLSAGPGPGDRGFRLQARVPIRTVQGASS